MPDANLLLYDYYKASPFHAKAKQQDIPSMLLKSRVNVLDCRPCLNTTDSHWPRCPPLSGAWRPVMQFHSMNFLLRPDFWSQREGVNVGDWLQTTFQDFGTGSGNNNSTQFRQASSYMQEKYRMNAMNEQRDKVT